MSKHCRKSRDYENCEVCDCNFEHFKLRGIQSPWFSC